MRIFDCLKNGVFRNKYLAGLSVLSVLNLLVMHYMLFSMCNVERQLDDLVYADNLMIVVFEVVLLTLLFSLLSGGRRVMAAFVTAMVTLVWSACNLVYARFFYQYIAVSAIGESANLLDPFVLKCIVDGFRWTDVYYVVSLGLAIGLYRKAPKERALKTAIRNGLLILCAIVLCNAVMHIAYCCLSPKMRYASYIKHRLYTEQVASFCYSAQPVYSNFQRGSLRTLGYQLLENFGGTMELSDSQKEALKKEIRELRPKQVCASSHPAVRNVIFILVESYMSFTVDLKVGGEEITPFLNSLNRDSATYYNGKMNPNITIGESSDGQFIYMTGLLPLRSAITVTKARKHSFPGLPRQLAVSRKMNTRMVIPTAPSMWNQDVMCKQYGVENLYSTSEYRKPHSMYLSDEQVFDMADSIDCSNAEPFFSMVLTFSMHQPYLNRIEPSFEVKDPAYSNSLQNYLNACHYTDRQLRDYFDSLKKNNLYENSLIVIAADHHVAESALDLPKEMNRKLPLFIIHGGFDPSEAWTGECNQLDVYTTLLDILGADTPWRGLGHSLLSPEYTDSMDEDKWNYSEWIIKSGYFDD